MSNSDTHNQQSNSMFSEMIELLDEIYTWTKYKNTPWAKRAAALLAAAKVARENEVQSENS